MSHLVLLDNEAVQALGDPDHPKHRRVMSSTQVVAHRKRRVSIVRIVVPTSVRVEAGWDRTAPASAFLNRLGIADIPLGSTEANLAADLVRRTGVSVPDAHLGAVMQSSVGERVTVLTSDPADMRAVAGEAPVTIVTI